MNVALKERNVYEDIDLESDVFYFKIGTQGLVSLHGRNYNIKKRMTADELKNLVTRHHYVQVNSTCYINPAKVRSVANGIAYFGAQHSDAKQLPISRRKQLELEALIAKRR